MRETVTVIGAGPVGSLLALMLARRGIDVEVYERRPDLRREQISAGRSINLAVSTRGLHALHQVGLDQEVLRAAVPMLGRMTHPVSGEGSFLPYGTGGAEFINSMSRGGLNSLLMTAAQQAIRQRAAGRVRIHFRQRLVGYDFAAGLARVRDEKSGEERAVEAKVIVGSDGSASALRAALTAAGATRVREEPLDFGYKELSLPAAPGTGRGPGQRFHLEPHALHIWPRGRYMLIALPNPDGDFTCTLFLPFEAPAGQPCFSSLRDGPAAEEFFRATFPDAAGLIPHLGLAFEAAPLGQMVTVRADRWSLGAALLLGDAAHAIVPFFGQGMNAGFEDCTLLDQALGSAQGRGGPVDWPALFAAFAEARRPDADAIAELALENFVEMRDKVADPSFLLQRAVEGALQTLLGGRYRTRYQLVTFSRVPYRVAQEAGRIQVALLAEVCAGRRGVGQVDVERARRLAEERLLPLLARHGIA